MSREPTPEPGPEPVFLDDSMLVRPPNPSVPEEAGLHSALADRRRRALVRLEATLGLDPLEPGGSAESLVGGIAGELMDPDAVEGFVDDLVAGHDLRPPRIGFGLAGASGSISEDVRVRTTFHVVRVDVPQIHDKVAAGAVVGLAGIDQLWQPAGDLALDLEVVNGTPARVDLLILGPGSEQEGSPDDRLVQTLVVIDGDLVVTADANVMRLESGSSLRLAHRDQWRLESRAGARVLLVKSRRITFDAVAEALMAETVFWPAFRADAPLRLNEPASSYGGNVWSEPESFARSWREFISDDAIARARCRLAVALPVRPAAAFSAQLSARVDPTRRIGVRTRAPGFGVIVGDDPGVRLAGAGRVLQLTDHEVGTVARLLDGGIHEVGPGESRAISSALEADLLEATETPEVGTT